jgi:hypothetical protein
MKIEKNNNEIIIDNKNLMKYIFEKCIPCFIYCLQNSIFNYEEEFDYFENNTIRIPENYYLLIDKENNQVHDSKITYGNDCISKSHILDISNTKNSPKNSNSSLINIDKNILNSIKVEEQIFQNVYENNDNEIDMINKEEREEKSKNISDKNLTKSKLISQGIYILISNFLD